MSWEEKITWVGGAVGIVVPVAYFAVVLGQLGDTSAADIAYERTLLIAIGVSIALTIVGSILTGIGTGVAREVRRELTGEATEEEIDHKDERDVLIGRRGELAGYYTSSVGVVGALALTMLGYEHFWIANALYLSFVLAAFVSSAVKLTAYRRGF